jgi:hypothetical protein
MCLMHKIQAHMYLVCSVKDFFCTSSEKDILDCGLGFGITQCLKHSRIFLRNPLSLSLLPRTTEAAGSFYMLQTTYNITQCIDKNCHHSENLKSLMYALHSTHLLSEFIIVYSNNGQGEGGPSRTNRITSCNSCNSTSESGALWLQSTCYNVTITKVYDYILCMIQDLWMHPVSSNL